MSPKQIIEQINQIDSRGQVGNGLNRYVDSVWPLRLVV